MVTFNDHQIILTIECENPVRKYREIKSSLFDLLMSRELSSKDAINNNEDIYAALELLREMEVEVKLYDTKSGD